MGEVERGDGEEEDGGREKSRSPLGCSCQGSGEADIIHLIGSYRLSEGFFLLYWAKGSEWRAPSLLLLPQQTLQLAFFCSPSSLCVFTPVTFPFCCVTFLSTVHSIQEACSFGFGRRKKKTHPCSQFTEGKKKLKYYIIFEIRRIIPLAACPSTPISAKQRNYTSQWQQN